MSEPAVTIRFDRNGQVYLPGETLRGEYLLEHFAAGELRAVEVSVLWYSEGKGDEDLQVHEFWRSSLENCRPQDLGRPEPFSTTLPESPLSYDGALMRLHWCVRVRAFLQRGKEIVAQKVFRLGNVPAAGSDLA